MEDLIFSGSVRSVVNACVQRCVNDNQVQTVGLITRMHFGKPDSRGFKGRSRHTPPLNLPQIACQSDVKKCSLEREKLLPL